MHSEQSGSCRSITDIRSLPRVQRLNADSGANEMATYLEDIEAGAALAAVMGGLRGFCVLVLDRGRICRAQRPADSIFGR